VDHAREVETERLVVDDPAHRRPREHHAERGGGDDVAVTRRPGRLTVVVDRVCCADRDRELADLLQGDLVGLRGPGATDEGGVEGHERRAQRVSRCPRWVPQLGQNFLIVRRSGSFRRFLRVM
jgi:hypothetical protein